VAELPDWEPGAPGVLCVAGPHLIPISTAIRAGSDVIVFALGSSRETLARLRDDPSVAYCLLAKGVAFTAYGSASVIADELEAAPVAAVELRVCEVADHLADGRTEMLDGAHWRRPDPEVAESDAAIAAELRSIAAA
jgi:hypothetical protein